MMPQRKVRLDCWHWVICAVVVAVVTDTKESGRAAANLDWQAFEVNLQSARTRVSALHETRLGSEQCPERLLRCSVVIAKSGTIRRPRTAKRHRTVWN